MGSCHNHAFSNGVGNVSEMKQFCSKWESRLGCSPNSPATECCTTAPATIVSVVVSSSSSSSNKR
uniref:Uncharacterized protein n=1 Tax=Octopus bimaculoides TaxID=37653 RepID=A0A0L8G646_OCTBM